MNICRLPKSNRADIPRSIIYPRFPGETIKFLLQHLAPDQKDLLTELGVAWNSPRYLDSHTRGVVEGNGSLALFRLQTDFVVTYEKWTEQLGVQTGQLR